MMTISLQTISSNGALARANDITQTRCDISPVPLLVLQLNTETRALPLSSLSRYGHTAKTDLLQKFTGLTMTCNQNTLLCSGGRNVK